MTDHGRPYAGASQAERESARVERLVAAGTQVFGTVGYRAATVGGICEVAGLNKRYFYASFTSLEDLLCEIYGRVVADLRRHTFAVEGDDPLTVLGGFVAGFLGWVQANPVPARVHLFEVLGVSARVDELYRSHARLVGDELCDRLAASMEHFVPTPGQRRLIGDALVGAGLQIAVDWVLSDYDPPLEQVLAELGDALLGLLPTTVT